MHPAERMFSTAFIPFIPEGIYKCGALEIDVEKEWPQVKAPSYVVEVR